MNDNTFILELLKIATPLFSGLAIAYAVFEWNKKKEKEEYINIQKIETVRICALLQTDITRIEHGYLMGQYYSALTLIKSEAPEEKKILSIMHQNLIQQTGLQMQATDSLNINLAELEKQISILYNYLPGIRNELKECLTEIGRFEPEYATRHYHNLENWARIEEAFALDQAMLSKKLASEEYVPSLHKIKELLNPTFYS
jgi:hypothetical protein